MGHSANYKPRQSGNPGGQSKALRAARQRAHDLIYARTDGGLVIIDFMVGVLKGTEAGFVGDNRSRIEAARFLGDRLWGKSTTHIEVGEPETDVPIPDMKGLSLAELQEIAAGSDDDLPPDVH